MQTKKIILATNNKGKVGEMKKILEPLGFEVLSQGEAGIDLSPEENGTTFEENSLIKARAIFEVCKIGVISDDSGLEIDALGKRPGVYSARYGGDLPYEEKCKMLINEVDETGNSDRTARFVAVVTYIDECGNQHSFRGECEGEIGLKPSGDNGFGFDPIFYRGNKSFAEISAEEKNEISHRAIALKKLIEYLK